MTAVSMTRKMVGQAPMVPPTSINRYISTMGVRKKTKSHILASSKRPHHESAGDDAQLQPSPRERIWQVVAMIPRGKVATYGQIAALAGMPSHARYVGRTLRDLPHGSNLPWHRVINASLKISLRTTGDSHSLQKQRLEAEGISFVGPRVARLHRWQPQ